MSTQKIHASFIINPDEGSAKKTKYEDPFGETDKYKIRFLYSQVPNNPPPPGLLIFEKFSISRSYSTPLLLIFGKMKW